MGRVRIQFTPKPTRTSLIVKEMKQLLIRIVKGHLTLILILNYELRTFVFTILDYTLKTEL